jgi:hypothetical protein
MNLTDSSASTAASYELDDQGLIPGRRKNFLSNSIQTASEAHTASYKIGIRVCFSGENAVGA